MFAKSYPSELAARVGKQENRSEKHEVPLVPKKKKGPNHKKPT